MSQIYCVTHKEIELPEIDGFQAIQVGDGAVDFCALRDNVGDHIATRNATYSENTAFYAIWKNTASEHVGFCHYRRFLIPQFLATELGELLEKPYDADSAKGMSNYASGLRVSQDHLFSALESRGADYINAFDHLLDRVDVILPHSNKLKSGGLMQQYVAAHPSWPIFDLLSILAKRDARLGRRAFEFFTKHKKAYWNNLFVMRREYFERYCEFLFPLLFELEEKTTLPDDPYQKRVFAFLSERLLNFWLWNEKLRKREIDWCMTEAIESGGEIHQRRKTKH